jgi:hypothetical protein
MIQLQDTFLTDAKSQRRIPDWGDRIFSPACVCIRPQSAEELAGFLRWVTEVCHGG